MHSCFAQDYCLLAGISFSGIIKSMKLVGHLLLLFISLIDAHAIITEPKLPNEGVLSADVNHGINPALNYGKFTGRVSDKDDASRIFKVHVENNNSKFFRAGDNVYFRVQGREQRRNCKAFVRNVEDNYFSMFVENLEPCWEAGYFRRGTILVFDSKVLEERVFEASKYREMLILRKDDFLKQLNGINHFLWTFDQQKVKVAADYDAQILEMQRARQRALDDLIQQKQEQLTLQAELMRRLNELDESLKFYRVERQELLTDRWNMDHDSALPVGQRPQELKKE
jgi:hypothetical protein